MQTTLSTTYSYEYISTYLIPIGTTIFTKFLLSTKIYTRTVNIQNLYFD